jgi:hypothetical protein
VYTNFALVSNYLSQSYYFSPVLDSSSLCYFDYILYFGTNVEERNKTRTF